MGEKMSAVHITKKGLVFWKWNGETKQNEIKQVDSFVEHLRETCVIEVGVTLEDIFNAVESDNTLKAFFCMYSYCDVDAFHEEVKKPTENKSTLDYLELKRYVSIWKNGRSPDHFEEGIHFHGIGPITDEEIQYHHGHKVGDRITWAIEFTPVNEMKHLEVRINPKLDFGIRDVSNPNNDEPDVSYPDGYTLLEVLGEIYWEISFVGNPEKRNAMRDELHLQVQEIKDGTAKTIPFDEIRKKEPIQ